MNPDKKYVTKGNELIEGISDLDLLDFKLINLVISKIDSLNDEDLATYTLSKREIMIHLGLGTNYNKLATIVKTIPYKKVIIHTSQGEFMTCYWFHVVYQKNVVKFRIDTKLKPYLVKLSRDFTQYELSVTQKFKSKYSFKFYEWFLMKYNKNHLYRNVVKLQLRLDDMRKNLFLSKSYATNFNFFKKRVLDPSLNDININTDLTVTYENILESRKIIALEFYVVKKSGENINKENIPLSDNSNKQEFNSKKMAKDFFDKVWVLYPMRKNKADVKISDMIKLQEYGLETIKLCIDRYLEYIAEKKKEGFNQSLQNGCKFFTKGFIDYLDENYTPYKAQPKNINNSKPIQSTNFPQREYDDEFFDSLYDNF